MHQSRGQVNELYFRLTWRVCERLFICGSWNTRLMPNFFCSEPPSVDFWTASTSCTFLSLRRDRSSFTFTSFWLFLSFFLDSKCFCRFIRKIFECSFGLFMIFMKPFEQIQDVTLPSSCSNVCNTECPSNLWDSMWWHFDFVCGSYEFQESLCISVHLRHRRITSDLSLMNFVSVTKWGRWSSCVGALWFLRGVCVWLCEQEREHFK